LRLGFAVTFLFAHGFFAGVSAGSFDDIMRMILALAITLLTGCSAVRDTRLDGTWVSDRAATVEYNRGVNPNMDWDKYSQIFGHLRMTYDDTTAVSDFKGTIDKRPLHLVRKDAASVTAKVWDDLEKKHRLVTMHFVDADTYWINIRDTDHREYFMRAKNVEPDGPANRSQPIRAQTNRTSVAAGSDR